MGGSRADHEPNVTVKGEGVSKRGEYIAMVEIDWKDERLINDFVFRTYCADPVDIEEITEYQAGDFIKNALSDCAHKNTELTTFESRGYPDIGMSNDLNVCKAGYSFIYVENNNRYKAARLKFMLTDYDAITFDEDLSRGHPMVVQPGHSESIVMKNDHNRKSFFRLTYNV